MSKAEEAAGRLKYAMCINDDGHPWEYLAPKVKAMHIADAMCIVAAAHDAEREPCRWTYDADSDLWTSSCGEGWTFTDGGPTDYNCKFCHGCGKPIEVTP